MDTGKPNHWTEDNPKWEYTYFGRKKSGPWDATSANDE